MSLIPVKPEDAKRLISDGAVLIDVREADEYACERIPGAQHTALSGLKTVECGGAPAVIFHCRSGARTTAACDRLATAVSAKAYVLEGGLDAWKNAGLPVRQDRNQPLELQRQVQIAAGSVVLIGVVLGALADPAFYAIPAFVGAGLVVAGVSGFCAMARLLRMMPWNRSMQQPAAA